MRLIAINRFPALIYIYIVDIVNFFSFFTDDLNHLVLNCLVKLYMN